MNDLPTPREIPSPLQSPPEADGRWNKTVAFLNRDIRSFFPGAKPEDESIHLLAAAEAPEAAGLAELPVESLVDIQKLPYMAFRREVLDWRDNFHANVTNTITRLQDSFIREMDVELGNTNMFRKLITRPASEVLQDGFVRMVRMPLITALRKEEAALNAYAQKWALFGKVDLEIDIRVLNSECDGLKHIGFKPSNRDLLVSRIQALLLGPGGTEEYFREQGLHISRKLLEAKAPC